MLLLLKSLILYCVAIIQSHIVLTSLSAVW